jgi:hypothetical protein
VRAKSVIKSTAILVLAIAAGAGITWLFFDRSQDDIALGPGFDGEASSTVAPDEAPSAAVAPLSVDGPGEIVATPPNTDHEIGNDPEMPDEGPTPAGDPRWDANVRTTLTRSDLSLRQKSQQLLDLAAADNPSATVDQRLEALDHGLNLLDDEDYDEDALRLALRSDLPAELGESILTDLHGRAPELLVGTCRKIAALEDHPLREEAQEIVNFLGTEVAN